MEMDDGVEYLIDIVLYETDEKAERRNWCKQSKYKRYFIPETLTPAFPLSATE